MNNYKKHFCHYKMEAYIKNKSIDPTSVKFIQGDGWFYCNDEKGKEYNREKVKIWYEENKDYKKEYLKEYALKNQDRTLKCETCNCDVKFMRRFDHKKSKKHLTKLEPKAI